jgi:ribose transport system ATP-binding protein
MAMSTHRSEIVLEMKGISKAFGGVLALNHVDFDLRAGEVQGLIGVNGAGKSTLMKVLAGAHADHEGTIRVNGEIANFKSPRDAMTHGVGIVYQELSIIDCLSVAENIVFGDYTTRSGRLIDWDAINREARERLQRFGFGHIRVSRELAAYDFAIKQIVEIVKVVRTGAKIIILDEPTSGITREEAAKLFTVIRQLKDEGKSIIFISHHLDEVLEISDRITILRDGQLVDVLQADACSKRTLVEKALGKSGGEFAQNDAKASVMLPPAEALDRLRPCLEVDGLSVDGAFADVSFRARYGEIIGLHGLIGSGHSEVGRCLFGLLSGHRGQVKLDGKPLKLKSPQEARKAGIGFLSDDRSKNLVYTQTIFRNATLPVLKELFQNYVFGFVLRRRVEIDVAQHHMTDLKIKADSPEVLINSLSGGNIQKVCLSKWLTYLPKLLILTEPRKGIDVQAKAEIAQYVKALRAKGDISIIVISMEAETIMDMCDRILVFSGGRIKREFCGEAVSESTLLEATS